MVLVAPRVPVHRGDENGPEWAGGGNPWALERKDQFLAAAGPSCRRSRSDKDKCIFLALRDAARFRGPQQLGVVAEVRAGLRQSGGERSVSLPMFPKWQLTRDLQYGFANRHRPPARFLA